ncbi:transglycosylase SLT domain-containing protein [Pseudomonas sp. CDFA 602]|uniref:transglycosylase SLT domain-containing protein n=1 Tax=Pseudomonas californiensis TaxID=2829823 RepID=UPI001E3D8747|nr:transglycosylase SLT domain-containing protein [Pseudomonas californiensis]MCD5993890.1 transglycosylase SLT domain-containing protein [Pseudomonas californiensis]MCD5999607.1 transglycosylase SLT domain-containing protein [Pseudomonas californiensis]
MPASFTLARSHSLARAIQIATFALGSLCAGCQSVDYSQPHSERTPRLVAGLNFWSDAPEPSPRTAHVVSDLPPFTGDDVWRRVAERCTLVTGQEANERIQRQRDWLLGNRGFLRGASERASPYLHFIVERLDERRMPMELALLPMIESAYNPMANSSAAAAGLWQFIPSTGRDFNLHQSAAYDARRDVVASSKAAMDYLTRLHDQFDNDWLLALAAYNSGEGTVSRAIAANRRRGLPADYWHLSLPKETQDYVPRLLALSMLVRDPDAYGVKLTPVANTPYFDVVELNRSVDLTQLAATAGVDEGQLLRLNSAFVRKKTLDGPGRLLIPKAQRQVLTAGITRITGESPIIPAALQSTQERIAERTSAPEAPPKVPAPIREPVVSAARPVQVAARAPVPVPVETPVSVPARDPVPATAASVQVAETTPQTAQPAQATSPQSPQPVQPMAIASVSGADAAVHSASASETAAKSHLVEALADVNRPSVAKPTRIIETFEDRSSPRKRDDSEYRSGPRELPTGPRVVVYASDPRQ